MVGKCMPLSSFANNISHQKRAHQQNKKVLITNTIIRTLHFKQKKSESSMNSRDVPDAEIIINMIIFLHLHKQLIINSL